MSGRSVKMWSGAWIAAMVSVASGAAGGCAHAGSFDLGVPYSGFAFAGDGPSCHIPDLVGARDHWVATPEPTTPGTGVGCMNAVMTVVAYEVEQPIQEWRGEVHWTGAISEGGDEYLGFVGEDSAIRWIVHQAGTIRVNTDREGRGGVALSSWLPGNATQVKVFVQRGYGTGAGAGLATRGSEGYGAGTGTGEHGGGTRAGGYSSGTGASGYDGGTGAFDGGLGATGPRGTSRAQSGAGVDTGPARGRGGRDARGHRGAGTSHAGTRAGSPLGGERASWVQPSSAELSRDGGRTPQPGGVEGGSAAGRGEPGDQGLSIGMALFGGVIRVPASIAPLLETTALLAEAGVSPTALARKWMKRALHVSGDRLKRAIAKDAAELAVRQSQSVRAKLSRSGDFARLSAAEQGRIIDAATDAIEREYLERLERAAASEVSERTRSLARSAPPAAGTPAAHAERVARENLQAYERVRLAARQARADFRPRITGVAAKGSMRSLTSFDEVADYIVRHGRLPDNFITKAEAKALGWNPKRGNLADVAPGKSIGGDPFYNRGTPPPLPTAPGRRWFEADIGYTSGHRGAARLVYSSDGLVYATIDHYRTFTRIR